MSALSLGAFRKGAVRDEVSYDAKVTAFQRSALSLGAFRKGAVRDVVSYDAKVTAFQRYEVFSAQKAKTSKLKRKKGCNTRTSPEVTHPSTTLAQARLTAEF
ncbi:unnamed protein product [Cochlearia groenlandica]